MHTRMEKRLSKGMVHGFAEYRKLMGVLGDGCYIPFVNIAPLIERSVTGNAQPPSM